MLNPTHHESIPHNDNSCFASIKRIMLRRIWLPKIIYSALPFVYIGLGLYAAYAALFMQHWSWVVPYFLLLACICLHAGLIAAALRIKAWTRYRNRAARGK